MIVPMRFPVCQREWYMGRPAQGSEFAQRLEFCCSAFLATADHRNENCLQRMKRELSLGTSEKGRLWK